ncbi:hypothetical protein [Hydrogenibacillus sp. N12]|uniref:hypothetical protein n=1 Tax=Hydrogenibacillus sp. N12 TaxID=2866627 RepID=UPI001C7D35C7|nr:hypothetical protein [Hydrogenibacillus sp. N12]QZA33047.1 hypothetical protein K2M58_00160 [Hydrogenibacillus sp. N12]
MSDGRKPETCGEEREAGRGAEAPIVEALKTYADRVRFHVPAHGGRPFGPEVAALLGPALRFDQTEVGALDDLHRATGVIREAEALAARAFGARRTRFLVGGASAGVMAAVLAVRESRPNGVWLAGRDAHRSFYHALMLAGAEAILIAPEVDAYGRPDGYDWARFCAWVERIPVQGAFVTTPTYFGRHRPLEALVRCLRRRGIPLVVDQAHGGHFGLDPRLPPSAVAEGADLVVHSSHKSLGALTMAAMLHLVGDAALDDAVDGALVKLQSSSPSYLLLASLDLVQQSVRSGALPNRLRRAIDVARPLMRRLQAVRPDAVLPSDDPLRFSLLAPPGEGPALLSHFATAGIDLELAFGDLALAIVPLGVRPEDGDRLEAAWRSFWAVRPKAHPAREAVGRRPAVPLFVPAAEERRRFALGAGRRRRQSLAEAVGRPLADALVPYPPGIPWRFPGDRLSAEDAAALAAALAAGASIHGVFPDGTVSVFEEAEG